MYVYQRRVNFSGSFWVNFSSQATGIKMQMTEPTSGIKPGQTREVVRSWLSVMKPTFRFIELAVLTESHVSEHVHFPKIGFKQ